MRSWQFAKWGGGAQKWNGGGGGAAAPLGYGPGPAAGWQSSGAKNSQYSWRMFVLRGVLVLPWKADHIWGSPHWTVWSRAQVSLTPLYRYRQVKSLCDLSGVEWRPVVIYLQEETLHWQLSSIVSNRATLQNKFHCDVDVKFIFQLEISTASYSLGIQRFQNG